jgi:hypothetical protein
VRARGASAPPHPSAAAAPSAPGPSSASAPARGGGALAEARRFLAALRGRPAPPA